MTYNDSNEIEILNEPKVSNGSKDRNEPNELYEVDEPHGRRETEGVSSATLDSCITGRDLLEKNPTTALGAFPSSDYSKTLSIYAKKCLPKPNASLDKIDFFSVCREFLTAIGKITMKTFEKPEDRDQRFHSYATEFIQIWWTLAGRPESFADAESMFSRTLESTKHGRDLTVFKGLYKKAKNQEPSDATKKKYPKDVEYHRLDCFCRLLQEYNENKGKPNFFLGGRTLAEVCGYDPETTHSRFDARLHALMKLGVLEKVCQGKMNKSTIWRYLAPLPTAKKQG
jgi:hypothetical protein